MPRQFVCLQITALVPTPRPPPPETQNSEWASPQDLAPAPGVPGCERVIAVRRPRAPCAASKVRDSRSLCQTPGR